MTKPFAVINIAVPIYYLMVISYHMVRPGQNYDYTKALLVSLLIVPILLFAIGLAVPLLVTTWRYGNYGFFVPALAFGLMALIFGFGLVYSVLGVRGFIWLLVYLLPIISAIAFGNRDDFVLGLILLGVMFFAAFFIGVFINWLLGAFSISVQAQDQHFQKIWVNYSSAAVMFFSVCVFGILNQLTALYHGIKILFKF